MKAEAYMIVSYDVERLKEIVDDLHKVTGISIAFMNNNRKIIYGNWCEDDNYCKAIQSLDCGRNRCRCSDADIARRCVDAGVAVMHTCHAGLIDVAVHITKDGISAGFMFFGRVRMGEMNDELRARLNWLGDLADCVAVHYSEMKKYTWEQLESLSRLISNMLFDEVIEIRHDSIIEAAEGYIDRNIDKNITLASLCKALFISKNKLYDEFRNAYGMTVNEYVLSKKIEKAKSLLAETKLPINTVSDMIGMTNHTYFFKLFKKKCSVTPTEYRRRANVN